MYSRNLGGALWRTLQILFATLCIIVHLYYLFIKYETHQKIQQRNSDSNQETKRQTFRGRTQIAVRCRCHWPSAAGQQFQANDDDNDNNERLHLILTHRHTTPPPASTCVDTTHTRSTLRQSGDRMQIFQLRPRPLSRRFLVLSAVLLCFGCLLCGVFICVYAVLHGKCALSLLGKRAGAYAYQILAK